MGESQFHVYKMVEYTTTSTLNTQYLWGKGYRHTANFI